MIKSKNCIYCQRLFYKDPKLSRTQWLNRKFCSLHCSGVVNATGKVAWNKGTKGVMKANSGSWSKGDKRISGENHHQWSGENPKYATVHAWVYNHLGKATKCEFCNAEDRSMYHWSNISGEYYRDLDDWQQLCVPCHSRFDRDRVAA